MQQARKPPGPTNLFREEDHQTDNYSFTQIMYVGEGGSKHDSASFCPHGTTLVQISAGWSAEGTYIHGQ
jgi:hypothetical protein